MIADLQVQYDQPYSYQGYTVEDKGLWITSTLPISAICTSFFFNGLTNTFLVKPVSASGTLFYMLTSNPGNNNYQFTCQAIITVMYDGTSVTVTPANGDPAVVQPLDRLQVSLSSTNPMWICYEPFLVPIHHY